MNPLRLHSFIRCGVQCTLFLFYFFIGNEIVCAQQGGEFRRKRSIPKNTPNNPKTPDNNRSIAVFGRVAGLVTDSLTGEPIAGAEALLRGTTFGAQTDLDGRYILDKIPAGKYEIQIHLISYKTTVVPNVVVVAGQTTTVNVALAEAGLELKTVVIVSSVDYSNAATVVSQQKNSAVVSDGIASETIKKSPDRNTSDVLRRIGGVTLMDDKYAVIRGLSNRYNQAMVNGLILPSSEADKKTFAFDIFPAAVIDQLFVVKTASPDLPGDFAGGVIQLKTRALVDDDFISLNASVGYNTISTFKNYAQANTGGTDILAFDDGTRALPGGLPSPNAIREAPRADKIEYAKLLPNDWPAYEKSAAPPNFGFQFAGGKWFKFKKNEIGVVGALIQNQTRRYTNLERNNFDLEKEISTSKNEQYIQNNSVGALLDVAFKLGLRHKFNAKALLNATATDRTIRRSGTIFDVSQEFKGWGFWYTSDALQLYQISGDHALTEKIKVNWQAHSAFQKGETPNLRRTLYFRNINLTKPEAFVAFVPPPAGAQPDGGGRFYSSLSETNVGGKIDAFYKFKIAASPQQLQAGFAYLHKNRSFDARLMGYVVSKTSALDQRLLLLPQDSIFRPENMRTDGFMLYDVTNASDAYKGKADLSAFYLMAENYLTAKIRVVWGARMEVFRQRIESADLSLKPILRDTTYLDVLPSLNFIYAINDKTNLRLAGSYTVSRPEFRELAPFSFFNPDNEWGYQGNPFLARTRIFNGDLRIERFPGGFELLSASLFYKRFSQPIEEVVIPGSKIITWQNVARGANNAGIELEARKTLAIFERLIKWSQWDNFAFGANFAYIFSQLDFSDKPELSWREKRPLQGQSAYSLNANLAYENHESGWGGSILLNKVGRRISQVGDKTFPDIYEQPRLILDAQISKKFGKYLEIKLNASDLLAQDLIFYQDRNDSRSYEADKDALMFKYTYGRTFTLNVGLTF